MQIVRALFVLLVCTASICHAASFDCEKKLTAIEESICDAQDLSDLDEVLMHTYKLVADISPHPDSLKKEQRRWLIDVRNRCTNSNCLLNVYAERISNLEAAWEKERVQSRGAPDQAKPFEGRWESCQLYRGEEICSSYLLIQDGVRVCGEWDYWATNRTYSGQLQATLKGPNSLKLSLICGTPGAETQTACDNDDPPEGNWEKTEGELFICNEQLHNGSPGASCATSGQSSGYIHQPLKQKERERMFFQEWLKRACLVGG